MQVMAIKSSLAESSKLNYDVGILLVAYTYTIEGGGEVMSEIITEIPPRHLKPRRTSNLVLDKRPYFFIV